MGQTTDRIPWWLLMIGIWLTIIGTIGLVLGGAVWLIVWLIGVL